MGLAARCYGIPVMQLCYMCNLFWSWFEPGLVAVLVAECDRRKDNSFAAR